MNRSHKIRADWIAVDWGTSHLRAWAMTDGGDVLASASSDDGMTNLENQEFEPALVKLVAAWLGQSSVDVIICGMAGSQQGWKEAPYHDVPCRPLCGDLTQLSCTDLRLRIHIVAGLQQKQPADVMRGEETQIAGFLALKPDFDGILCMPGTHTKWVEISAAEVVSFQTYMTGEMFSLLSKQSVLRHSVDSREMDDAAFSAAVSDAISRPQKLAARLFSIRADAILNDISGAKARARLSGSLIGAELAAARPYWLGQQVAVIGARAIADSYILALESVGVRPISTEIDRLTLAGLGVARSKHRGADS